METKFRTTLKLAHVNSWEWNMQKRELYLVNVSDQEEMERISPLMAMETVTIPNYPDILFEKKLVRAEDEHLVREYEELLVKSGIGAEVPYRLPFQTMDGDTIWLQFFGMIVADGDGDRRAVGYYTDVTKQIEIAKRTYDLDVIRDADDDIYEEVLLGLSADYSNVFWIDLETGAFKLIRLDATSDQMIGNLISKVSSYKDVIGYYIEHFVFEDDKEKLSFLLDVNEIEKVMVGRDIYTRDYRSFRMSEIVYCQVKIVKGSYRNRKSITIGFKNIDKDYRFRMEQEYDALTGLYNRNAFFRYMQKQIEKHPDKTFNLLISDIENFKRINDLYGEKKGDEVLQYVGKFLGDVALMVPGTIFGRYSGDQFVGLFMTDETLQTVNADLLTAGMQRMYENSPIGHFEVKFGMYFDIDRTLSPTAACDRALMAVRTIKHQYNVAFAVYDNQMEQSYQKELRILENMEEALATGQFKVYYQPKHDGKTGALIGAEALVRWEHPEFGFMSPGDFIPLFEKNGFITNLDLYVFRQVYEDQKRLHDQGLPVLPVSINASRLDLLQQNFTDDVITFLKERNADPSWFHVEVTENIFMENEAVLCEKLIQLRNFGIQIELDDFGAGYTSLSILCSLPLDIIKLDMGIIRHLGEYTPVVEASIRLAHVLGYKTTAEGVETIQQMTRLKAMGCDGIQGYYFSKPLPVSGYTRYVEGHCK